MSWDGIISEWMCADPYKYADACTMAATTDFAMYAGAGADGADPWPILFKEPYNANTMDESGNTVSTAINETSALKATVECDLKKSGPPKGGLWLGGRKYTVTQQDKDTQVGDHTVEWLLASAAKDDADAGIGAGAKGVHIVKTKSNVIIAHFDEGKGFAPGNTKKGILAFAEYVCGQGL